MKTVLIFLFSLGITLSQAQNSVYNQTWISGAYQKNVKKWNFRLDGSYRSIEYFKYNRQFIIREISSYNFNSHWQLGAGPCLSWQYPYGELKPVMEFRPTFQLTAKANISNNKYDNGKFENNKSEISIRFRWELRYFITNNAWTNVAHRPRLALRTSIALSEKLSFAPMVETMWQTDSNQKFKFSVLRITPTFNYKYKGINFQLAYMFQFLKSGIMDEIDNNYLINLSN